MDGTALDGSGLLVFTQVSFNLKIPRPWPIPILTINLTPVEYGGDGPHMKMTMRGQYFTDRRQDSGKDTAMEQRQWAHLPNRQLLQPHLLPQILVGSP